MLERALYYPAHRQTLVLNENVESRCRKRIDIKKSFIVRDEIFQELSSFDFIGKPGNHHMKSLNRSAQSTWSSSALQVKIEFDLSLNRV